MRHDQKVYRGHQGAGQRRWPRRPAAGSTRSQAAGVARVSIASGADMVVYVADPAVAEELQQKGEFDILKASMTRIPRPRNCLLGGNEERRPIDHAGPHGFSQSLAAGRAKRWASCTPIVTAAASNTRSSNSSSCAPRRSTAAPTASTCTPRSCAPPAKANSGSICSMRGEESPFYSERERAALAWTEALHAASPRATSPDGVYEQSAGAIQRRRARQPDTGDHRHQRRQSPQHRLPHSAGQPPRAGSASGGVSRHSGFAPFGAPRNSDQ